MKTIRINSQVGAAQAQTAKVQYPSNVNQPKRPVVMRQLPIFQVLPASAAVARTTYNFFAAAPQNPPVDGDNYRSPYIKKNMEIIGLGLSLWPQMYVAMTAAEVALLDRFNDGSSVIWINKSQPVIAANSEIGPVFEQEEGSTTGTYIVTVNNRAPVTLRDLNSGAIDNLVVNDKMDVNVVTTFNQAFGFTHAASGRDCKIKCILLARPIEEQFVG